MMIDQLVFYDVIPNLVDGFLQFFRNECPDPFFADDFFRFVAGQPFRKTIEDHNLRSFPQSNNDIRGIVDDLFRPFFLGLESGLGPHPLGDVLHRHQGHPFVLHRQRCRRNQQGEFVYLAVLRKGERGFYLQVVSAILERVKHRVADQAMLAIFAETTSFWGVQSV